MNNLIKEVNCLQETYFAKFEYEELKTLNILNL